MNQGTPSPLQSDNSANSIKTTTGGPGDHTACQGQLDLLQKKISYLEKQLDNTENALKNNQNLVSGNWSTSIYVSTFISIYLSINIFCIYAENSRRCYELNTQVLQLKQSINQANRTGDELRLKLDKKDDLVRRTLDDKNELHSKLSAAKDRIATLELELAQRAEKVAGLEEEKDKLGE